MVASVAVGASANTMGIAAIGTPSNYTLAEIKTAHLALHILFCSSVQLSTAGDLSHLREQGSYHLVSTIFDTPLSIDLLLPAQRKAEELMASALRQAAQIYGRTFADRDVFRINGFQHRAGMGYIGMDVDVTNPSLHAMGPVMLLARINIGILAQTMYGVTLPNLSYASVMKLGC